jgi:hypothetical protein
MRSESRGVTRLAGRGDTGPGGPVEAMPSRRLMASCDPRTSVDELALEPMWGWPSP